MSQNEPCPVLGIFSQLQIVQDVPLLYDVDRVSIWLHRLENLAVGIGRDFVDVDQDIRKKLANQSEHSTNGHDQDLEIQDRQLEILGLFALNLGRFVHYLDLSRHA
ncbi:MAG: hypothetical protein DWQ04_00220 [Chloroflexi bacterium]|nr:MAG: hypothetical protein DWQ04_00220 [Chloroflexota bacterium]